jgi:predicted YcjX-like family ATPase
MNELGWGLGRFVLTMAGASILSIASASAFQDQWKVSNKSLSQYVSEGFEIHETLLRHLSPFAKYEYVYFLRKDVVLVRCTESVVTDRGAVVDTRIVCGELVSPFDR